LESLLQERSKAQPQIDQQPLQPADSSLSAAEWVVNLRNELPSIPRPEFPDFEILYDNAIVDEFDSPSQSPNEPNRSAALLATGFPAESIVASLSLDDIEPSADFQEDAAFLQSTAYSIMEADTWVPPPLPIHPGCDG
jgi:hypothetical protein